MEDYDYKKAWMKIELNSLYGSFNNEYKLFDDYEKLQKEKKNNLRKKKLDSLF
jgi:hypothetical protein